MRTPTRRRRPERREQEAIARLLRSLGAMVYVLGTVRRRGDYPGTMQSPGLPDLLAFVPVPPDRRLRRFLSVEVKAPGGRLRPAQAVWRDWCAAAGLAHVIGGLDEVIAWLLAEGVLRREEVAWYRQPVDRAAVG